MDFCQICLEQVPSYDVIQVSCGCKACLECHRNWASSQLSDLKTYLKCPFPQCGLMLTCLEEFLLPSHLTALRENQLMRFLTFNKNIRWCPEKTCGYAGFFTKSNQQSFFCEKCQQCWIVPGETFNSKLEVARYYVDEGLNVSWKALFCKTCSGCEVFIEKNQGCRHIDCIMCGTDFCWYCKQSYKTHQQIQCSTANAVFIYKFAIFLSALLLLFKLVFVFPQMYNLCYLLIGVPIWCIYILIFKIFFCVILLGLLQMLINLLCYLFSSQFLSILISTPISILCTFPSLLISNWVLFLIPGLTLLFSILVKLLLLI